MLGSMLHSREETLLLRALEGVHLRNAALPLCVIHGARIADIDASDFSFDLADWTLEPLAGPEEPASDAPETDDPHGHDRIIQRLAVNGVHGREAEDDGDETDPQDSDEGHGPRELAQVEGPVDETLWVHHPD